MAKKEVTKPVSLDPRGGRPREKCVTYIEGIDRILNGGLPVGNIVLLDGTVGSGKTTLAMEFLINGAKNGETCCYISVTEPSSKMLSNLQTSGFFDYSIGQRGKFLPVSVAVALDLESHKGSSVHGQFVESVGVRDQHLQKKDVGARPR